MNTYDYLVKKFPKSVDSVPILELYLRLVGVENIEQGLSEIQVTQLIIAIHTDFLNYKISVDEMSDYFGKFSILLQDMDIKQSNTAIELEMYSELEHDLRNDLQRAKDKLEKLAKVHSVEGPIDQR